MPAYSNQNQPFFIHELISQAESHYTTCSTGCCRRVNYLAWKQLLDDFITTGGDSLTNEDRRNLAFSYLKLATAIVTEPALEALQRYEYLVRQLNDLPASQVTYLLDRAADRRALILLTAHAPNSEEHRLGLVRALESYLQDSPWANVFQILLQDSNKNALVNHFRRLLTDFYVPTEERVKTLRLLLEGLCPSSKIGQLLYFQRGFLPARLSAGQLHAVVNILNTTPYTLELQQAVSQFPDALWGELAQVMQKLRMAGTAINLVRAVSIPQAESVYSNARLIGQFNPYYQLASAPMAPIYPPPPTVPSAPESTDYYDVHKAPGLY